MPSRARRRRSQVRIRLAYPRAMTDADDEILDAFNADRQALALRRLAHVLETTTERDAVDLLARVRDQIVALVRQGEPFTGGR